MNHESRNPQNIWDEYTEWFHSTNVWKGMSYHGIRTLKFPSDAWNYQEIIFERGIDFVVETGTRHGGSALFFADTLKARNASGFVVTIDIDSESRQVAAHESIRFLLGDSGSPEAVAVVRKLLPAQRGPLFLILDSDHTKAHVLRELEVWVPSLQRGDYLVVEDTIVNGRPVRPNFGPGPWEAIMDYREHNPGQLWHDKARETKFGTTAAPNGYYVKL